MRARYVAVRDITGSDDVCVVAVGDSRDTLRYVGADRVLPIHYRSGSVAPLPGDRLGTWVDVSTRYVVASR